jgi:hypothetical protein
MVPLSENYCFGFGNREISTSMGRIGRIEGNRIGDVNHRWTQMHADWGRNGERMGLQVAMPAD